MISLVFAVSRNGVIGSNGSLPWHMPSDLKRFKAVTLGKPVIMGRKTWDSLPRKPLPGRLNIVISRKPDLRLEGVSVAATPEAALRLAAGTDEVCVIGGGEIFAMFLPLAHRIYRSVIEIDVAGDTFFPSFDETNTWVRTSSEHVPMVPGDSAAFEFQVLERR